MEVQAAVSRRLGVASRLGGRGGAGTRARSSRAQSQGGPLASNKFVQSVVEYDCANASNIAYVPCSATERLRAPADSVTAGMDIHKTCFELGREEEDDDSNESGVAGNARRWCCAPQSAAS